MPLCTLEEKQEALCLRTSSIYLYSFRVVDRAARAAVIGI